MQFKSALVISIGIRQALMLSRLMTEEAFSAMPDPPGWTDQLGQLAAGSLHRMTEHLVNPDSVVPHITPSLCQQLTDRQTAELILWPLHRLADLRKRDTVHLGDAIIEQLDDRLRRPLVDQLELGLTNNTYVPLVEDDRIYRF
jgi:hypothetical protein